MAACTSSDPSDGSDADAAVLSAVDGSAPTTGPAGPGTSSAETSAVPTTEPSTNSSQAPTTTSRPGTPATGTTGSGTSGTGTRPATTVATTAAPATTVPTTAVPSGWQAQLLSLVNAQRANAGVAPLTLCASLTRAAQDYSRVLAGWGTLSHVGPDGSTLYTRVAAAGYGGYLMVGENLASGQLDAATVVNSWMGSSGHRANLLHQGFTQLGAGRTDVVSGGLTIPYWVLDLGAGGSC